jgi:hypothetical protein
MFATLVSALRQVCQTSAVFYPHIAGDFKTQFDFDLAGHFAEDVHHRLVVGENAGVSVVLNISCAGFFSLPPAFNFKFA